MFWLSGWLAKQGFTLAAFCFMATLRYAYSFWSRCPKGGDHVAINPIYKDENGKWVLECARCGQRI
ncbi:MAG: hypothetical protein A3D44_00990 [Candidatus Staskawiczbacteria bacterium RIFCSPHIGHO2_02_FULL_42_22]|uniref:Uncharacterized protein n=1 Tax=Candidatus Staskawiczbacteria bacterium RIFCSPHIGHO2_02_FULL_42_22 TaxID=1802207 RepID=A0A1G2I5C8_9BACT|nr:MAG: hypothetical protein A3D44_00990 [Candidatus Staskawiczbacteria bacterium RIFCSPHIGHO2_02_FULL_42_22]